MSNTVHVLFISQVRSCEELKVYLQSDILIAGQTKVGGDAQYFSSRDKWEKFYEIVSMAYRCSIPSLVDPLQAKILE